MKIVRCAVMSACIAWSSASAVRADDGNTKPKTPELSVVRAPSVSKEPAVEPVSSTQKEGSELRHRVELQLSVPALGHEHATILSLGQDVPYSAASEPDRVLRLSGIVAMEGAYGALDLRPYTDASANDKGIHVATGGLEARLSTPFTHRFVLGLYHHSSHNFSEGAYGFGTNLNSVYGNVRLFRNSLALLGTSGEYEIRTEAHVFLSRNATPYVLTDDALVPPKKSGETTWRYSVHFDARHPYVRTLPSLVLNGESRWRLASGMLDLPITFKVGDWFLGSFGEHLYIGPYCTFGWNVRQTELFGDVAWSAGLRMDILVSNTTQ